LNKNNSFDHVVVGDAIDIIGRIANGEKFGKIIYG